MNKTNKKGFKMALPFIAGVVAGGLVALAFNNRNRVKSALECGLQKGKSVASDVKEFTTDKFEKISKDITKGAKRGKKRVQKELEKTATTTKKKRAVRAKKQPVVQEQPTQDNA